MYIIQETEKKFPSSKKPYLSNILNKKWISTSPLKNTSSQKSQISQLYQEDLAPVAHEISQ